MGSWNDWDPDRNKKRVEPGIPGWEGPFLYMLSGYRGSYEKLYPADRPKASIASLDSEIAERLRMKRIRRQEKARQVADEFNELMEKGQP